MNANVGMTRFYCQCKSAIYQNGICTTCGEVENALDESRKIEILEREISRLHLEARIQEEKYSDLVDAYKSILEIVREQSESVGRLIMMVDRP